MAPRSPEDPQVDPAARRDRPRTPAESTGSAQPARQQRSGNDATPAEAAEAADSLDFGSFVSQSVRSSADRLKGGSPRHAEAPPAAPRETPAAPVRPERPSRYWRDSFRERSGEEVTVRGSGARRFISREPAGEGDAARSSGAAGGGNGGAGDWWRQLTSGGDGQGPNRQLIGLIGIGILLLIALVFLISRLGGDDNGGEETPSPSATSVLEQPVGTPGATDAGPDTTTPEVDVQPTPTIRRGGDNQRPTPPDEESGNADDGAGQVALAPVDLGPIAQSCPKACLVRLENIEGATELFAGTGSRPSYEADGIAWLVSSPEQIAHFELAADVELIRKSADTLSLYIVEVPDDGDESIIPGFGKVLDAAGDFRLIEVEQLPARVRGLTDAGFAVHKLAPPTPSVMELPRERTNLDDIEIGSLMGEVSRENIDSTITTLQGIGAADGAALGTRYYTFAGNQIAADYLFQQLESYGLDVWYEDFLTPEGILLVNVVGELPGRDDSAVYAVMAHLDTTSDAPGTAPGADDNATGIASSLELARVLSAYELEHPVRIVFANAEEVGILGSDVWARTAKADGVPIEGVFNVDSVGSDRQGRLLVFNSDAESAWMQDLMIRINDAYGLGNEIMSRQNPQIVADDNMVRKHGIEAVMIARELYGWSPYHHTTGDVKDHVSIDNVLGTTYVVLLSIASLV